MLRLRWPCLALCAAIFWLVCLHVDGVDAKPILEGRDNPRKPKFVFRVDSRSPDEIRAARGFLGRATENTNLQRDSAYSIDVHNDFDWRNDPTVYVSTTAEFGVAARFAQAGDYIYLVRARSNMLSVNIALGRRSRYPWQEEWVAMGGIPFTDVVSSWQVPEEDIYPGRDDEDNYTGRQLQGRIRANVEAMDQEYKDKYKAQFKRNPDYKGEDEAAGEEMEAAAVDAKTMRSLAGQAATDGSDNSDSDSDSDSSQPSSDESEDEQLAGLSLRERARQFMDSHGAEVGWQRGQQFPLWAPVASTSQAQPSPSCAERAAHVALPLLRNISPDDQTRNLANAMTEAGKQLCAASDQACKDKSSSLLQTRFPQRDPGKVERTARELEAICERSLSGPPAERHGGPDSVAGPSGLCRSQASKALKPVRAKSQDQKRPTQEVVSDVKGAVCAAQPPSKKAKGAKEQCENSVQELLSVFNDVGGGDIGNYLSNPAEIDKDLCFEPGTFEYLSSFPWESDQAPGGQDQASPSAGSTPQQGQSSWPQFVQQVQQQFRVAEQQLREYIDAGIQSLQRDHRDVYDLFVQSFPGILQLLEDMARLGLRFSSCLPDKPASGRQLKARAEQDVCKKVLAAIGQSAPGGSQPDKTPSTTPGSPSGQNDSQDSKGNSGPSEADKNLGLAIGIPVSAFTAGLAVFAASADGAALLASAAASLGISTEVGSAAEAVTSALGRTTSSLTQVTRQAVQRVVGRVSRLGHRVANPLLRQITSRALRSATERASEHIPLLSFSG
ncbi:hypothetical protein H634G_06580 [Metarhizium anisopliae BRIP 53293]|uniref:Enterotoxin n=1 Tax=Metarhizium anisopliae BRIP 53293 TaxID=1291518 RepID=A0A0D9NVD0_METAN|nr:hypothetical protein H634G_06580 [Metarhizium anisopliae BRIP 53293]KJK86869.1 hypothetical protein H633G_09279 [Metarhizium anisopliae BRIP 53284]